MEEIARYPLAARAFLVEIRAAGEPSRQRRRAIQDRFAELLRLPDGDADVVLRTGLVAAGDELVARELSDHGTERLAQLGSALVELATRILLPGR
jgi:hypothetical protein